MKLIERLFAIIAPYDCLSCGAEGDLLCRSCRTLHLAPMPPRCYRCAKLSAGWKVCNACRKSGVSLRTVAVRAQYDGLAKDILHHLKFQRAGSAADTIAKSISTMSDLFESDSIVSEVPTASSRIRLRGYDQAKLIAKAYSKQTCSPYMSLLWRMGNSRQLGTGRAMRYTQARTMFRVRNASCVKGRNVVLVDDVLTTGATVEAAAQCLMRAGAASVSALIFAHRA